MRDWILCSKCGSRVTVLEADGRQKIVIEIRAGRMDPTLPLTAHRQAITKAIKRAVGPYQLERKIANVKGGMRTYEKRGWVRKNGRGWKRTDKIAPTQF